MNKPLDLDGPPNCVECGAPMLVTEHEGEGDGGVSLWSAACWAGLADDRHPEWVDLTARPTLRDQPGTRAMVAEIERLRAERQAVLDAGGDLLWAGGAKTLPEAVAGICHAFTVELDRRERERDQSPAAKVRDILPYFKTTDADLVKQAIERAGKGEYRRRRCTVVGEILTQDEHFAAALCRACGLDPDEMGGDGEGEE